MIINQNFTIIKLLRINMIIFDIFITKFFILKYSYRDIEKYLIRYIFIITLYGIYCYIADLYNLPKFMNIFINNPSYADFSNNIYNYYGGWTGKARIYTTFYEPSIYAVFLVLSIAFIRLTEISKVRKVILMLLIIFNIICTDSRTGIAVLVYMICIYLIYKISKSIYMKIEKIIIFIFPILNIFIINLVNEYIFNDLSSQGRSGAPIFYLELVFKNIKTFIFGNGLEYKEQFFVKNGESYFIESIPHNSYVDFLYTGGIIYLIFFICILLIFSKNIKSIKNRMIIIPTFIFCLSFEQYVYVESIIIFLTILFITAYKKEKLIKKEG